MCSCAGADSNPADLPASRQDLTSDVAAEAVSPVDGTMDRQAVPDALSPDSSAVDLAAEALLPEPLEPAVCGSEPHSWLPAGQVGEPLIWEESLLSNLSSATVDEMFVQAGYTKLSPVPFGVRNFRLRYTTQDHGKLVEATAMVGVPVGIDPNEPLPIILWLHPTTGANDDCAPSADPLLGPGQTTVVASQGYIAVAPDFLGMLGFGDPSPDGVVHPYLVAEPTALASLDSIRAVVLALAEADEPLATPDTSRIGLYGGSQGGHACFFVDRYAPHYAPELDIVAVSAVVPGLDVQAMAGYIGSHFVDAAMTLIPVLTSMRYWYGHPADMLQVFTNQEPNFLASTIEENLGKYCGLSEAYSGFDGLADIYTDQFLLNAVAGTWDQFEPWGCFLRENSVPGTSVPRVNDTPYLTTFAAKDTLAVADVQREAAKALCQEGYRIEFIECAGEDHVSGAIVSIHYSFNWLKDRIEGKDMAPEKICDFGPPVDCHAL